jgi:N-succinyldiaminopimelate aminotransferase
VHPDRRADYASLVRFAFCKKTELLERAAAQLAGIRVA